MPKRKKPLPNAATLARYEKFASEIVKGVPASRAVIAAGYKARGNAAEAAGYELLGRPVVQQIIERKQAEHRRKSEMSEDEARRFLVDVIRTPIGEVDKDHALCQYWESGENGTKVRMPDKLKAMAQLAQMCGWNQPTKFEVDAWSPLERIVRRVMETNAQSRPPLAIEVGALPISTSSETKADPSSR